MWVIRKTTRDQTGNPKSRFFAEPPDKWVDNYVCAHGFISQKDGNEYAIDMGIYFHHGYKNVAVVKAI